MFGKKNAVVRTKKYTKLIRFFVIIALIVGLAGLFAYGWQEYEENKYPEGTEKDYSLPDAFINFARLINEFLTQNVEEEPEPLSGTENDPGKENEERDPIIVGEDPGAILPSEETSSEEQEEPEIRGGIVEKGNNEGYYSFNDSLFIGDYFLSQAHSLGYFEHTKYAYTTGLDMNTVLTKKLLTLEEEKVTLANYAAGFSGVEAVYIMFSAESISWMDFPTFSKKYTAFVDEIVKSFPEAHIYIQPILPINEEKASKRGYSVTNEKIKKINEYLFQYAEENSFWILDIAGSFANKEGYLPEESTTNGIRLEKAQYEIWADYIVTHKAHK